MTIRESRAQQKESLENLGKKLGRYWEELEGMTVEVVQPKAGRTNQRDTGICSECGGIRPDHTLEEWRNCDGKPKPTVCPEPIIPLRFVQRLAIAEAVQRTGNPKKAAKALGIGSTTIYRLLRVYGITTPYRIGNESKKKSRSGQQK